MATIGSLDVILSAQTDKFIKGLEKSQKAASGWGSTMKSVLAGAAGGLAVGALDKGLGAAAGAIGSFIAESGKIDATAKQAHAIGIMTDSLIGLEHAAGDAGVEQETLFGGLNKLAVNLEKGSEAFAELGLSAEELRGVPLDEAFGRIADSFGKVESVTRKNYLSMELFGKSGQKMLNLLDGGSGGIKAATDQMRKLGFAVNEFDARRIEEMNDAVSLLGKAVDGIKRQTLANLAPFVKVAADELLQLGTAGESAGSIIGNAFEDMAVVADAFLLIVDDIERGFTRIALQAAKLQAAGGSALAGAQTGFVGNLFGNPENNIDWDATVAELEASLAKLDQAAVRTPWQDFIAKGRAEAEKFRKEMEKTAAATKKMAGGPMFGEAFANTFDGLKQQFTDFQSFIADLMKVAKDVKAANQTPLQTFQQEMAKLEELKKFGQISADQFALATGQAFNKLDQAAASTFAAPKAIEAGSAEAVSLMLQQRQAGGREDPQKRVEEILKRQEELDKQQLKEAKEIAAALRDRDKVAQLPGL